MTVVGYKYYWRYIDSFPLFDINKFMSEEQLPGQSSGYQIPEVSKRRRTPSQYASRIADFKSVLLTLSRTSLSTSKRPRATGNWIR